MLLCTAGGQLESLGSQGHDTCPRRDVERHRGTNNERLEHFAESANPLARLHHFGYANRHVLVPKLRPSLQRIRRQRPVQIAHVGNVVVGLLDIGP